MSRTQKSPMMVALLFLLVLSFLLSSWFVRADPTGSTISAAVTENAINRSPDSRSDPRSTITTMILTAVQKTGYWKAYVGNVTGNLTLDDATNMTIYDWDTSSITGNVFASRYNNLTWSNVTCAPVALINTESAFNNMTAADSDRLNATFNYTVHKQFDVALSTLAIDTCRSTVTYLNDTRQTPNNTTKPFQEILVRDSNDQFIYLTSIETDVSGFDNNPYDFQMIVAESDVKVSPTPYYFYVELR